MIAKTVGEMKKALEKFEDDTQLIGYDGSDELVLSGIMIWKNNDEDDPNKGTVTISVAN